MELPPEFEDFIDRYIPPYVEVVALKEPPSTLTGKIPYGGRVIAFTHIRIHEGRAEFTIYILKKAFEKKIIFDFPSVEKHLEKAELWKWVEENLQPWQYTLLHEKAHVIQYQRGGFYYSRRGLEMHNKIFREALEEIIREIKEV